MELLRRLYAPDYMLKSSQKQQDKYSTSEIYKSYAKVAWPAVVESVLIGLVSFIDNVMVASMGHVAVASVGLTNQPRLIFVAIFLALNVGVTAIVSRRKGENRREDANKCLAQAMALCFVVSAIAISGAIIFAEQIMRFAGAMDDTLEPSVLYFRIIMVGLFFTSQSMVINAAQRGSGNTRIAMTTNIAANLVNCVFNALLINGLLFFPRLGILGAALATMLGNMVAFGMSLSSICHKGRFLEFRPSKLFHIDIENLGLIGRIASSAAVEQVFLRIGFFMTAKLVAELGTLDLATHTICMSLASLTFCFGDGFGVAATSLVGQNLGKKRPDLSMIYGKSAQRIGFVVAIMLFLCFTLGGELLVGLFMTDEAEAELILELGTKLLVILAFVCPAQISQVIFSGCLRGAGDTKYTAGVSLVSVAIVRPILTYILCYPAGLGVMGAWFAIFADQMTRLLLIAPRFSNGKWTKIKV